MNMKRKLTALLLLLALLLSLTACGDAAQTIDTVQQAAQTVQELADAQEEETPAIEEDGTYTTKEDVARYIHTYGHLPDNFIAKKQAQALGWEGGYALSLSHVLYDCERENEKLTVFWEE